MSDDRKPFAASVISCARCQGNHDEVLFRPLANSPATATHWANCPRTDEPILMSVVVGADVDTWVTLASGRKFDYQSFGPDDIHIEDVAAHLSKICRFGGGVRKFYSVAQHCSIMCRNVDPRLRLHALLHDAAEFVMFDCVSPLKKMLPQYKALELRVQAAVFQRFGICPTEEDVAEIKRWDYRLLATERRDVAATPPSVRATEAAHEPLRKRIRPLDPHAAELEFLWYFKAAADPRSRLVPKRKFGRL